MNWKQSDEQHMERVDAQLAQLEEDKSGVSEEERQRVHTFNGFVKELGEGNGPGRGLATALDRWASSQERLRDDKHASRKWWRGKLGENRSAVRLWMIRTRLLEAVDLSPSDAGASEEEAFYLAFLSFSGDGPKQLPPALLLHPLWQDYGPHRATSYKPHELVKVFGHVPLTANGVHEAREMLRAEGLWGLSDEELVARSKRGGTAGSGKRKIAHLIGAEHYMPLTPCEGHPTAPFSTQKGQCTRCRAVERWEHHEANMTWYVKTCGRRPSAKRAKEAEAERNAAAARAASAERSKQYRERTKGGK